MVDSVHYFDSEDPSHIWNKVAGYTVGSSERIEILVEHAKSDAAEMIRQAEDLIQEGRFKMALQHVMTTPLLYKRLVDQKLLALNDIQIITQTFYDEAKKAYSSQDTFDQLMDEIYFKKMFPETGLTGTFEIKK